MSATVPNGTLRCDAVVEWGGLTASATTDRMAVCVLNGDYRGFLPRAQVCTVRTCSASYEDRCRWTPDHQSSIPVTRVEVKATGVEAEPGSLPLDMAMGADGALFAAEELSVVEAAGGAKRTLVVVPGAADGETVHSATVWRARA